MQTLQLVSHIGNDGLLHISVPEELKDTDVEVLIVLQQYFKPVALPNKWVTIAERVHNQTDGGWSEQLKKDMQEFRDNFDFKKA
jgi:hypothetical protein